MKKSGILFTDGRTAAGSCVDTVMSQSYGVPSGVIEPSIATRDASAPAPAASRRLLVVSHPAVVTVNQEVYLELVRRGWELTLVVPRRWRHEYSTRPIAPAVLDGLAGALLTAPVALAGRPQRHFYLARCRALCARIRPQVAFVEAEPFSLVAAQWRRALMRAGVPFGVQCAEN